LNSVLLCRNGKAKACL